jgi:putative photosynthetic complex assembly protein
MSTRHADHSISTKPMWVLAALVCSVLVMIATARWAGWVHVGHDAPVAWSRALHFQDHSSGAVLVIDASTEQEIARFEGEQGFVRGSLRALVRERKRRDLGPEQPFILEGHSDGRLSLRDPTTQTRIPLDSFGPSQLALFQPLRGTSVLTSSRSSGVTP